MNLPFTRKEDRGNRSPLLITLVALCVAGGLSFILSGFIATSLFIVFVPAVAIASAYGGLRYGFLATIIAAAFVFGTDFINNDVEIPNIMIRMGVFSLVALTISLLQIQKSKVESELRVEELKGKATADNVSDVLITIDEDSKVIFANSAVEKVLGWKPEEFVGQDLSVIMPDRYKSSHKTGLAKYLITGKRKVNWSSVTIAAKHKEGHEIPVEIAFGEFQESGRRYFTAVMRDVTEKKKTEERLANLLVESKLNEGRYKAVVDGLADFVFTANPEGKLIYSPMWDEWIKKNVPDAKLLVPLEEVPNMNYADFVYSEDRNRVLSAWEHSIKTGEPYDQTYRRNSETLVYVRVRAVPVINGGGKIKEWVGVSMDVTEEVLFEQERERYILDIKESKEMAEKANESKDQFLATLSHELRTPLVSILGYTNMISTGKLSSEQMTKAVEVINRNAKLQVELIEDLLDISRVIAGKISLQLETFPICEVVKEVADAMSPQVVEKGLKLSLDWKDAGIYVSADRRRIAQIMMNLLSNAVKFTERGEISIVVDYVENIDKVRVSIKDTGIGIKSEILPRLFQRFKQADSSITRRHGGLGLGLSIVKTLTDLHYGRVWAESEEGLGSTFTFELDVVEVKELPADIKKEVFAEKISPISLSGLTLLITDDDDDTRYLFAEIFNRYGATVFQASSAKEARELVEEHKNDINVCIFDIGMPNEDGYSLIRSLREKGIKIPALALTAFVGKEYEDAALAAGFDAYIPKPPSMTYLVRKVQDLGQK